MNSAVVVVVVLSAIVYGWRWSRFNRSSAATAAAHTLRDQSLPIDFFLRLGRPPPFGFAFIVVVATYRTTWREGEKQKETQTRIQQFGRVTRWRIGTSRRGLFNASLTWAPKCIVITSLHCRSRTGGVVLCNRSRPGEKETGKQLRCYDYH